jgi:hypothetical protein
MRMVLVFDLTTSEWRNTCNLIYAAAKPLPECCRKIFLNLTNEINVREWISCCYEIIGTICDGNVVYELNFTGL